MGLITYLVDELPNPSTDYFVRPTLRRLGGQVMRCGFDEVPERSELVGCRVVLVRYVSRAWRHRIDQVRNELGELVFFMDDDVLDPLATVGQALGYRFKLYHLAARHRGWLIRQHPQLWVSTPWLMTKYADWAPRLILPRQIDKPSCLGRVFYHGSGTHKAEAKWLRPMIAELLAREEHATFEIIGDESVARLYRGIPRVTTVHFMKWPAYQHFCQLPGRTVGLNPILDSAFNKARSCTKFFDITRCGAVGIYSSYSYCAEVVEHRVSGIVLANDQDIWLDHIQNLLHDHELRARMLQAAIDRIHNISTQAV